MKRFPEEATASRALYERARTSLPGGNTRTTVYLRPHPIYAASGDGCRVRDVDGVERIDCINNFTSLIHGYRHPATEQAVLRQVSLGTAFGLPTESEIDLAELLCARLPSVDRVRFTNSGTEAVMMALKAARAYTGRPKIAKIEGAYHGSYDYAEVSLDPAPANWGEGGPASVAYAQGTPDAVLDDTIVLPFNQPKAAADIVRAQGSTLAAILLDPMPNRAGLVPAEPAYIRALADAAGEVGALLVFDEVISFRLDYRGAQHVWGARPDLTALGKIIGGGFPVGAVGGRADVMAVFDPSRGKPALPHGGTFSANPMSMRAGLATMQSLDGAAFERLGRMGDHVRSCANDAFARKGVAGCAVGMGSLLKIHFTERPVRDYRSAYADAREAARSQAFALGLLNRGILAAGYGLMALSTPMTDADLEQIVQGIAGAIDDAARV